MPVRPRKISEIKPLFTNLAQTSHYQVSFGTLPPELMSYLRRKGIDSRFITEDAGLLCYSASLPTTNFGTFSIDGNYMGIQEKFAHSRIYSEISLEFYVDKSYKMLNFLETWMEFIASGSFNNQVLPGENAPIIQNGNGYFTRIQYPTYYKANQTKIVKFDRDYDREIEYTFRGLFPSNIGSLPVSYANSDVLKVTATFFYDRYIAGKTTSYSENVAKDSNNRNPSIPQNNINSPLSADDIQRLTQEAYRFPSNNKRQDIPTTGPLTSQSNVNIRII